MSRIRQFIFDLWQGNVPLGRVFWEYAVIYGSVLNLLTTIASFAVLAADGSAWLSLAVFFVPAPYNALMVVSVWRSADRYDGPAYWAVLARSFIIVWAVIATLA